MRCATRDEQRMTRTVRRHPTTTLGAPLREDADKAANSPTNPKHQHVQASVAPHTRPGYSAAEFVLRLLTSYTAIPVCITRKTKLCRLAQRKKETNVTAMHAWQSSKGKAIEKTTNPHISTLGQSLEQRIHSYQHCASPSVH